MSKPFRVAIAGFGWFGRIHYEAWLRVPGVEVVAICDTQFSTSIENVKSPQDDFHASAYQSPTAVPHTVRRFSDVQAMLTTLSLDMLDVVVPEQVHFEVARLGLEHGLNVLVEKPVTLNSQDLRRLIEIASEKKKNLYCDHILRFDSRYFSVKESIERGGCPPRYMSLQRHFQSSAADVYGRSHPFYAAMIHDLDVAIWLAGKLPKRVVANTQNLLGGAYPDSCAAILSWADGAQAVLQNAWYLPASCPFGFSFEATVMTAADTFVIRNPHDIEVWSESRYSSPEMFFWPASRFGRSGAIVEALTHFASCARNDRPSDRVPLPEVCGLYKVIDALSMSAKENAWVDITL